jgi:hypothetical protein
MIKLEKGRLRQRHARAYVDLETLRRVPTIYKASH